MSASVSCLFLAWLAAIAAAERAWDELARATHGAAAAGLFIALAVLFAVFGLGCAAASDGREP
jgi:hypothetical protein